MSAKCQQATSLKLFETVTRAAPADFYGTGAAFVASLCTTSAKPLLARILNWTLEPIHRINKIGLIVTASY
jgi:hypothetical protein